MTDIDAPFQRSTVEPADVLRLQVPEVPDVAFGGFGRDAFAILDRLRARPHIDQYQIEKAGIRRYLKTPFKRYRDDLVVNVVLPNRLRLETERNVFSRLLKNDFGAGGCHHHFWLSFYRPGRTRLKDIQLAHSLHPDGLVIAVIARKAASTTFNAALDTIYQRPGPFLRRVNALLRSQKYVFTVRTRRGETDRNDEPLDDLPVDLDSADSFRVQRMIPAETVLREEGRIMYTVLETVSELWPVYQFLIR